MMINEIDNSLKITINSNPSPSKHWLDDLAKSQDNKSNYPFEFVAFAIREGESFSKTRLRNYHEL